MTPSTKRNDTILLIIGIAITWKIASLALGDYVLPGPLRTLVQLWTEINAPDFGGHLLETSTAFFTALVIAVIAGTIIGLILGAKRLAGDVMEPILIALYSIPKISLYPVILLMFGLGMGLNGALGKNRLKPEHAVAVGVCDERCMLLTAIRRSSQPR